MSPTPEHRPARWAAGCMLLWAALGSVDGRAEAVEETGRISLPELEAKALRHNADIAISEARLSAAEADVDQVRASRGARLTAMGWMSPMFGVQGTALEPDVTRDYSLDAWGPYTHTEATLVQPLSTFGRIDAAVSAAQAQADMQAAAAEQEADRIVAEVRSLYLQLLFFDTVRPTLDEAASTLQVAIDQAEERYRSGDGTVTTVDRMRLRHGASEVARYRTLVDLGVAQTRAALLQLVGDSPNESLQLADSSLPGPPGNHMSLADAQSFASRCRPELSQIQYAREAVDQAARAERMAFLPVLFAAATFEGNWTPSRADAVNPFHYDPYNGLNGGVALGLRFDLEPATTRAHLRSLAARASEVEANARKASTGIPAEVTVAWERRESAIALAAISEENRRTTSRWIRAAAAGTVAGLSGPRDLLEGLAADLLAQRAHAESLLQVHAGSAELTRVIGARDPSRAPASACTLPFDWKEP